MKRLGFRLRRRQDGEPAPAWERLALRAIGIVALASVHFWLAYDTLKQKSPTVDETAHLPAGRSFLEKHDFRVYRHNPPLARALAALAAPKLAATYGEAYTRRPAAHWAFARDCLAANADTAADRANYLQQFTRGRRIVALWSALTLPVVFWWASWWFGAPAGWAAAVLYCFSPNMLAHAGMVTTDLPAASTILMAAFAFARWLDGPAWLRAVVAGVLLGVALLTKFSALWLALLFPIWAICHPLLVRGDLTETLSRLLPWQLLFSGVGRQFVGLVFYAWLTVNAGYLFQGRQIVGPDGYKYGPGFTTFGEFPFLSDTLTRPRLESEPLAPQDVTDNRYENQRRAERINRFRGTPLERLPCPFPYEFVMGFDDQKWEAEGKYQMYFHGDLRRGDPTKTGRQGWWYYYLAALGLKLPVGTLVLFTLGVFGAIFWSDVHFGRFLTIFVLGATPVLAMSFLTDINLGLRYVLPALPFVFIVAGAALQIGRSPNWLVIGVAALAWNVVVELRQHPHELAYFNEFAGGPERGRYWLIDSNLDWGQDLRPLARWIEKHPEWKTAKVAFWGSLPIWFESEDWRPLPPPRMKPDPDRRDTSLWPGEEWSDDRTFGPRPGKYIVSVNFERGHEHHTTLPKVWLEGAADGGSLPFAERGTNNLLLRVPFGSYTYFQKLQPRIEREVGYSVLFYDVTLEQANEVRKELNMAPLDR